MPSLDLTSALVIAVVAEASVISAMAVAIRSLYLRNQALSQENRDDGRKAIEALTLTTERERVMQEAAAAQERSVRESGAVVVKLDRHNERLGTHVERLGLYTDRIERRGA